MGKTDKEMEISREEMEELIASAEEVADEGMPSKEETLEMIEQAKDLENELQWVPSPSELESLKKFHDELKDEDHRNVICEEFGKE